MSMRRRGFLGATALGAGTFALTQAAAAASPNYLLGNNFAGVPASTIGKMKET